MRCKHVDEELSSVLGFFVSDVVVVFGASSSFLVPNASSLFLEQRQRVGISQKMQGPVHNILDHECEYHAIRGKFEFQEIVFGVVEWSILGVVVYVKIVSSVSWSILDLFTQ